MGIFSNRRKSKGNKRLKEDTFFPSFHGHDEKVRLTWMLSYDKDDKVYLAVHLPYFAGGMGRAISCYSPTFESAPTPL